MTLRDQTWHVVLLTKLIHAEEFRRRDLGFDDSERHTVRRTLSAMEDMGWLCRESETGWIWEPGVLTRYIFGEEELSPEEERELEEHLEPVAEQLDVTIEELKDSLEQI